MLKYSFFLPTRVIHEENAIANNIALLQQLGRRALFVTGRNSARMSGALQDATAALEEAGIEYEIFDQIENNPSLENVAEGGRVAREYQPDFIFAIGGGSPLDGAKAVATLAVNDIPARDLFKNRFENTPLPIVAVPTTAGTGSEVTPYSVLTDPENETKRSFSVPEIFPKIAFLDYRYTMNLPADITIDTAVDALSHLVEGYLSRRASNTSDMFAERGMRLWGQCIQALESRVFDAEVRDKLLVASALGGFTISHTGTTMVHALGYPLTYFHGLPHGRANGILMGEYLRFVQKHTPERVANVLQWIGLADVDEFAALMDRLFAAKPRLSEDEIKKYVAGAKTTKNVANSPGSATEEDLAEIFRRSLE